VGAVVDPGRQVAGDFDEPAAASLEEIDRRARSCLYVAICTPKLITVVCEESPSFSRSAIG